MQNRRDFIRISASTAASLALSGALARIPAAPADKPVRLGFIGVGGRGTVLLRLALKADNVEIPAICDIDEQHAGRAQRVVERRDLPSPELYTRGPFDYRRMLERDDLDGIICATPWDSHAQMMVDTMEAGKYGGVEVPASTSLDESWQLVEASEKTGVPCMMLENYCYFRNVMLALNLLDKGLLGDVVHCEVGYQKDERFQRVGPDGEMSFYTKIKTEKNGNLYPTHAIGPAGWSMNINHGDRFDYMVSMSSRSKHLHEYLSEQLGADHPAAKIDFVNGDVNTSLIRTKLGRTVTIYYDTQSPRPWDPIQRIQASKGIVMGSRDEIYVESLSEQDRAWDDITNYYEEYDHPLWKKYKDLDVAHLGRGVSDFLCVQQFIEAVRARSLTPLDVYDAVSWSVITPLSIESVAQGSRPVEFPDFTRGKWEQGRERIYYGV